MKRLENLKNELGSKYIFEKYLTESQVLKLLNANPANFSEQAISALTVGNVKIAAVIFKSDGKPTLGYDVFVKDSSDSAEWICYDNLSDEVCLKDCFSEGAMFYMLDRFAEKSDLSYTECNFEVIDGKVKKESDSTQQPLL